ncbi:hypothetical protein SLS62_002550 [Diatrype stigma]|uniref:Uncharacterized protein n=1 Tax=Diatrype stigma TaxID=117547 RepID=A0AAN9V693_9PEZI
MDSKQTPDSSRDDSTSELCIPPTKLFRKLDADMGDDELECQNNSGHAIEDRELRRREKDCQIDQSLSRTIRAFAARWFPLVVSSRGDCLGITTNEVEEIAKDSWRSARKDMLKVVNRTSYRSALTLYLFAQTPIPVGISEDEELDGISGLVCTQTALLQIQRLRERRRRCRLDAASGMLAWEGALANCAPSTAPSASITQAYMDYENRAYWAAVTWDTSSSLSLNLRTLLTSGLNGACSEPAWRLARTFLLGSFHTRTEPCRTNGFEPSDEVAYQVITAAGVCKLHVWKNITSLKEALREGVEETTVLFVWKALREAMDIFEASFRPLLNKCERRLHFMNQLNRLCWYEVNLRYYLGLLLLGNAIEMADRSDLLSQIAKTILDAEHEIFNVLKFGIDNTYTIPGPGPGTDVNNMSTLDAISDLPEKPITASFIAIDPHPNLVVDSVLLVNKVVSHRYRQGEITHDAYSYLSAILLKALGQLPQSSKSVHAARESLQRSVCHVNGIFVTNALVE